VDAIPALRLRRAAMPSPCSTLAGRMDCARLHNDVYVDDGQPDAVGTPMPTQNPVRGKWQSRRQQRRLPLNRRTRCFVGSWPQKSTRPDGSVVHVVPVSGDTLFGMALAYGVTAGRYHATQQSPVGSALQLGQELIVKSPDCFGRFCPGDPDDPVPAIRRNHQPTAVAAARAAPAVPSTRAGCAFRLLMIV